MHIRTIYKSMSSLRFKRDFLLSSAILLAANKSISPAREQPRPIYYN